MTNSNDPTSLVLVGILPSVRDLEIARLLGWYRIPLRFAPKDIDVDYLVFYQTTAFGDEHRWKVEYFADMLGQVLTTGVELFKDEPDNPRAKEKFCKLQIEQLLSLQHPILADKWRRLTLICTTVEHLLQGENICDLEIRDEARGLIWQALRDRSTACAQYISKGEENFKIDHELLPSIEGWMGFEYLKV
jgi:hypothetical protein